MKRQTLKKLLMLMLAAVMLLSTALVSCTPVEKPAESTPPESTPEAGTPAESTPSESTPEASTPEETPAPTEPESTPEEVVPVVSDFEIYSSNSVTPTACNYALKSSSPVKKTFRGLFKVQEYGEFDYKFFFSNNVDSTFSNGSHSYRAMKTDPYKIISATVGTTSKAFGTGKIDNPQTLTFDGSETRNVDSGEMFWSDAVKINVKDKHWIVFEWTVEHTIIAATNSEGVALALFECSGGKVNATDAAPMPALVGADKGETLRVGFIGDSITMGIGAGSKNYKGWVAQIAERVDSDVSVWNLAVGYARGDDAANSPAWLEKAKNNDVIVINFGVNDINSGPYKYSGQRNAVQIKNDIAKIAETCRAAGAKVIICSTPPYTYANSEKVGVWRALVKQLKALAEDKGYQFFDFAALVGKADDPSIPAYGGHPNAEGCKVVAEAFLASGLLDIHKD